MCFGGFLTLRTRFVFNVMAQSTCIYFEIKLDKLIYSGKVQYLLFIYLLLSLYNFFKVSPPAWDTSSKGWIPIFKIFLFRSWTFLTFRTTLILEICSISCVKRACVYFRACVNVRQTRFNIIALINWIALIRSNYQSYVPHHWLKHALLKPYFLENVEPQNNTVCRILRVKHGSDNGQLNCTWQAVELANFLESTYLR